MAQAREVFAKADGLFDVHATALPGVRDLLKVRADVAHDWQQTAVAVAAEAWRFEAFRADDVTVNLQRELAAEAEAEPADLEARRAAWAELGRSDPRLRAERLVLAELEALVARRKTLWDPRLEEVAVIAASLRGFWTGVAPALPAGPDPEPVQQPPTAPARALSVRERLCELLASASAAASPESMRARQVVGIRGSRGIAVKIAWHSVAQQCAVVRDHARQCAERTASPERRRAYVELATRCGGIVEMIDVLRAD